MQSINFSIIIPHKNIPDLLQRCLDSIPYRDDIQIIIVDDNSDSTVVDFTHFPGLGRSNTEIYFTKEGKGAGYARNIGLQHAIGKWLIFADADDFFTENAFDCLLAEIDSLHEIIYFRVTSCYSDTYRLVHRDECIAINKRIDNYINNVQNAENWLRYRFLVPWGKMIKADLIKRELIKFEEVMTGNDIMFSLLTGYFAYSISAVDHTIYCVTVNRGSLSYTSNIDILKTRYLVLLRYNAFLKEHNKGYYQTYAPTYYILSSFKYGLGEFIKCIRLAIHYKTNPFAGIFQWSRFITFYKGKKKTKFYIVKK